MNNYQEYAVIDSQIKQLTEKKEVLKLLILGDMYNQKLEKKDSEFGKFTIAKIKKWTYPDKVLELEEKFKTAKAKAESNGDATYEEQDSLRFTGIKL